MRLTCIFGLRSPYHLKAIGGGPRSKIQVDLIRKCFSIRSQRFLRNVNISLRSRDIYARVRLGMAKIALFREFSNIKIILKMSQNHEYFHTKSPLDMFYGVFFMYLHIVDHKIPEKPAYLHDFGKY